MNKTKDSQFEFWVKYLKFLSIFFAIMGVVWAVLGSFDPFGIYDQAFANSFYGQDHLPKDVQKPFNLYWHHLVQQQQDILYFNILL